MDGTTRTEVIAAVAAAAVIAHAAIGVGLTLLLSGFGGRGSTPPLGLDRPNLAASILESLVSAVDAVALVALGVGLGYELGRTVDSVEYRRFLVAVGAGATVGVVLVWVPLALGTRLGGGLEPPIALLLASLVERLASVALVLTACALAGTGLAAVRAGADSRRESPRS